MKHATRVLLLLVIATFVVVEPLIAQDSDPGRVQQKFVSSGSIRMHLEAGDYTIEGTDATDIVATYRARDVEDLKKIKVNIKPSGSNAELWVKGTPHNDFHATIEVPRLSSLWTRLSAGNLSIKGVEGDKDVECHAGNVEIEVAHPEDYRHRDASVTAGSIDAAAFNVSKDGLFRSFRQDGEGKYRLHVHLAAGDVTLRGPS
jgi:hypothetical protein